MFVTGQKTLGHDGTIKAIPDDFPVVRSHSCFASIDIPKIFLNASANSEQIKTEFLKHLTAVLENHDGTFDINERPTELERVEAIAAEFMNMFNRAR